MRTIITILSTGFILYAFSEPVFWARYQVGVDIPVEWAITWLVYSIMAYAFLATVALSRARSMEALFLCGALYGWLDEGVVVRTMYENFPLQVAWTGLAWHALISVMFGWGLLRFSLQTNRISRVWLLSTAAGIIWGMWAIFWWVEPPGVKVSPLIFTAFALILTAMLGLSYWAGFRLGAPVFHPGRYGPVMLGAVFGGLYFITILPTAPWSALMLLPLLLVIGLALRNNQKREARLALTDTLAGRPSIAAYVGLAGFPLAASAIFSLAAMLDLRWFTNRPAFLITSIAGAVLFVWSTVRLLRSHPGSAKAQDT